MYRYFCLLLLITGIMVGCSTEAGETKTDTSTVVKVSKVIHKRASLPIRTSGKVAAKKEAALSFKTGGIIQLLKVEEGNRIHQGQVLATLNMDEVNAYVQQAESAYNKALRDSKRFQNLFADSVASLEQKQNVETALKVAEANLNIARFNARYSTIIAPFNGHVLKRFVNVGELVNAGMPVLALAADQQNWIIRVELSDRDITRVQLQDSASVSLDAYPGKIFPAFVSEKAAGASPVSGLFELELALNSLGKDIYSGFIGSIIISPSEKKELAFIPVQSLTNADQNTGYVFLINKEKNRALKQEISIAYILDDSVAVSGGLEKAAYVVSEGMEYLSDGALVTVQ